MACGCWLGWLAPCRQPSRQAQTGRAEPRQSVPSLAEPSAEPSRGQPQRTIKAEPSRALVEPLAALCFVSLLLRRRRQRWQGSYKPCRLTGGWWGPPSRGWERGGTILFVFEWHGMAGMARMRVHTIRNMTAHSLRHGVLQASGTSGRLCFIKRKPLRAAQCPTRSDPMTAHDNKEARPVKPALQAAVKVRHATPRPGHNNPGLAGLIKMRVT